MNIKGKLKSPSNLRSVLNAGRRAVKQAVEAFQDENAVYQIVEQYAALAIHRAIEEYDKSNPGGMHNLTGNTRSSFTAGIYHDGQLKDFVNAFKLNIESSHDIYHYTRVGASGFQDRGSGEFIGEGGETRFVRNYRNGSDFVEANENGYAYIDTIEFLRAHTPHATKGYAVVVASVSPYVEFIHQRLNLDILDSAYMQMERDVDMIITKVVSSHNSGNK